MTPRERISAAYAHKESDRIPVDFGGHRSSGIMLPSYRNLRRKLGMPNTPGYVFDVIQQLAFVESDVLDWCGADVVELGYLAMAKPEYWKPWIMPDGSECRVPAFAEIIETDEGNALIDRNGLPIAIQRTGQLFFEQTAFPLVEEPFDPNVDLQRYLGRIMWARVGIPPAPYELDDEGMRYLADWSAELRSWEERAIYATFGGSLIETGQFAYRMDNFLCMLAAEPREIHRFLDRLTEHHLDSLGKYLDAVETIST